MNMTPEKALQEISALIQPVPLRPLTEQEARIMAIIVNVSPTPTPAPGTSALAGWCEGCEHDAPRFKLLCNECTRKHREPVTDKYIAALAEGKKGE